jgi:lysophospholipase L1-like esterase
VNLPRAAQPFALLLAPILMWQGRRLKKRIPRLPEAAEPSGCVAGAAPAVRLAVFGDSTGAGVGADRHEEALAGHLGTGIARATGREVYWRAVARSGATSATARDLVPRLAVSDWRPDVVIVVIGVNDLKNLRRLRDWKRDIAALLAAVRETAAGAEVVVSGMAPVGRFPSLPQPLRWVMGLRARAMDHELRRDPGFVPLDASMARPELFGRDGFHPSSRGYQEWAEQLAGPVIRVIAGR